MDETNIFSVCINEVSNHLSKTIHLFQMHTIEEYSEILEHALSDFQYPAVAPGLYTPVKLSGLRRKQCWPRPWESRCFTTSHSSTTT